MGFSRRTREHDVPRNGTERVSQAASGQWSVPCSARGWRAVYAVWVLLAAAVAGVLPARASVALLLEMPYGQLGTFNPTGHAALYFDHICAASPLRLRPCGPGELGVVLSRYDGIQDYDWVAVPLIPYLYGVETAAEIPSSVDRLAALRMRDLYRREHLLAVAPDTVEGGMPQGNWYELVGSAFDRTIYGFQVRTTTDQDTMLIDYFNDRPNVTRYEGAFRNCADFSRIVLNRLYPHAIHRNYVADFGLTTPKSVARGLVHFARKNPGVGLQTFRVPQIDGNIPRSLSIQGVTGSLLTRYAVPMTILSPHVTAVVLVAYIGKGRFAVPKNAPILDVPGMEREAMLKGTEIPLFATENHTDVSAASTQDFLQESGMSSGSIDDAAPAEFLVGPDCGLCEAVPFLPLTRLRSKLPDATIRAWVMSRNRSGRMCVSCCRRSS